MGTGLLDPAPELVLEVPVWRYVRAASSRRPPRHRRVVLHAIDAHPTHGLTSTLRGTRRSSRPSPKGTTRSTGACAASLPLLLLPAGNITNRLSPSNPQNPPPRRPLYRTTRKHQHVIKSRRACFHLFFDRSRVIACLLYTSPSPRDQRGSRMPSSA